MLKAFLSIELVIAVIVFAIIWQATRPWRRMATAAFALVFVILSLGIAFGRDLGQWDTVSQQTRFWFEHLMQPDNPAVSCCGEADAYWADSFEVDAKGELVAIITDDRPDEPLMRAHIDVGTRIVIPRDKLKFNPLDPQKDEANKNPTGHGIVFLSRERYVYCYVAPGGV